MYIKCFTCIPSNVCNYRGYTNFSTVCSHLSFSTHVYGARIAFITQNGMRSFVRIRKRFSRRKTKYFSKTTERILAKCKCYKQPAPTNTWRKVQQTQTSLEMKKKISHKNNQIYNLLQFLTHTMQCAALVGLLVLLLLLMMHALWPVSILCTLWICLNLLFVFLSFIGLANTSVRAISLCENRLLVLVDKAIILIF